MNPDDLRRCDAIEVVIGQGAKPGGGGMLLGQKISERVAEMRTLPAGIDQRSACRHPDWTGPDDLEIKIEELREITDWEKPIYVKVGASRPYYDTALAVKSGADVVVLDGMQGGTAATQEVFIEHVGLPILAAIRPAVQALQDLGLHRKVQLIVSGGIRNGADVAKALALGADAVSIGTAALIALGDNDPRLEAEYEKLGTVAGAYDDWHEGRDPRRHHHPGPGAGRAARPGAGRPAPGQLPRRAHAGDPDHRPACGKSHVHNLEPEDLVALTVEAAAMAGVPLAGTNWIPGRTSNLIGGRTMSKLSKWAKDKGVKYFLISFTDLFGTQRSKLVPAEAIDAMAKTGAGFAGFATWLDMTPADPDMFVIPDPDTVVQLPWKREVGWFAGDPWMSGKPVDHAPRNVLKAVIAEAAAAGYQMKTGRPASSASIS
ncbi:MAG: glutamate synthase-related protein [Caulobacteraceae bacterium]